MKKQSLVLALAAVACASAFAEGGAVTSSSTTTITSGTGLIVGQGAPSTSVTVLPSSSVAVSTVPGNRLLPGAAQIQASQTTVMGGPAPGIASSTTVVTNYWTNVPANAEHRADFQRWMRLKP